MMKKLIIAAAGSGKTRTLIHKAFNCKDAVLITTYTDKNKDEIAKRFIKLCGYIPSNITILPWYTFILKHFVKPFQGCFWKHTIKGINLVNASSTQYIKEEDIEHFYFDHDKKIYSDKIAQFGIKCNKHYNNIAINTLAQIYKYIFIDEVQDISGYDLDIIKIIFECPNINLLCVGDPRQGVFTTSKGQKNSQFRQSNIIKFFSSLEKKGSVK